MIKRIRKRKVLDVFVFNEVIAAVFGLMPNASVDFSFTIYGRDSGSGS